MTLSDRIAWGILVPCIVYFVAHVLWFLMVTK